MNFAKLRDELSLNACAGYKIQQVQPMDATKENAGNPNKGKPKAFYYVGLRPSIKFAQPYLILETSSLIYAACLSLTGTTGRRALSEQSPIS